MQDLKQTGSNPVLATIEATKARTSGHFLNQPQLSCRLKLVVDQSLGVVSRILLAMNKRGLAVDELKFRKLPSGCTASIELLFCGDSEQVKLVRNDLLKLYDLVQLSAVLEDDPSTHRGDRHELKDLPR